MTPGGVSASELALTDPEIELIRRAIAQWGGPAHSTEEFAVAMGFLSYTNLRHELRRMASALAAGESLPPLDWARLQLATELSFVSQLVGTGYEWQTVTGWRDDKTILVLRSLQKKLASTSVPLIGDGLGTRIFPWES